MDIIKQAIRIRKQSVLIPNTNKNVKMCMLLHKLGIISHFKVSAVITLRLKLHELSGHNAVNKNLNNFSCSKTLRNTFQGSFDSINFNVVVFTSDRYATASRNSLKYLMTFR